MRGGGKNRKGIGGRLMRRRRGNRMRKGRKGKKEIKD